MARLFCVRPNFRSTFKRPVAFSPHHSTCSLSLLLPLLCLLSLSVSCSSCLLLASLQIVLAQNPLLMSDTCIVCLGDLGESASDPLAVSAEAAPRLDAQVNGRSTDTSVKADGVDGSEDSGQIAQLLPCGHILHNNCLKPWVERANSCPICRRSFNVVELSDRIGGMFLSHYLPPAPPRPSILCILLCS